MKNFKVTKYYHNGDIKRYGVLPEVDVKRLLKGYKYDELLDMWFSEKANIGYELKEV